MYPTLFQINLPFIGTINIYSYGLMVLLGVASSIYMFVRRGLQLQYNKDFLLDLSFYTILTGFIGARIMYVVYYNEQFDWAIFKIWEDKGFNIAFGIFWVIVFYMMFTGTIFKSVLNIIIYTLLIFFIFGRAGYILDYYEYYNFEILAIWKGGIIFYGGLFGGIIGGIIFLWIKKVNILKISDIAMPLIFLGLVFGRIGCFLRGCCWGAICKIKLLEFVCVQYPKDSFAFFDHHEKKLVSSFAQSSLPVYPAQIFEAVLSLILFIFFWTRFNKKRFDGQIAFEVLLFYAIQRFVIEFFRGDMSKIAYLSFAQFISLPVILLLLVIRFTLLNKYYKTV